MGSALGLSEGGHGVRLQQPLAPAALTAGGSSGAKRRLAAAASGEAPAVYSILDGSTVLDKVQQLEALPGGCWR